MGQLAKHLGLIITLLAWAVFPLPECYLTKPHCPQRKSHHACPVLNRHQPNIEVTGSSPCCPGLLPPAGKRGTTATRASSRDGQGMLVASLSPRFLLPDAPELVGPYSGLALPLQTPIAPSAGDGFHSAYRGERADPIPILLRTLTLLI